MTTNTYLVVWAIEVDADNPQQAGEAAMEIMVKPSFDSAIFDVRDENENATLVKVPYPVVR